MKGSGSSKYYLLGRLIIERRRGGWVVSAVASSKKAERFYLFENVEKISRNEAWQFKQVDGGGLNK
jgi:hypothetical protein